MITIHQRHRQTDRRTGRQTTCNRNTALCTKVHRAVKTLHKNNKHAVKLVVTDAFLVVAEQAPIFFKSSNRIVSTRHFSPESSLTSSPLISPVISVLLRHRTFRPLSFSHSLSLSLLYILLVNQNRIAPAYQHAVDNTLRVFRLCKLALKV